MDITIKTLNMICLWIIIGLMAAGGIHWLKGRRITLRQDADEQEKQHSAQKRLRLAVGIIMLVLIVARCIGFGSIPGGINQDEAMAAVEGLSLAHHGTDRFGTWLPAYFLAWGNSQMNVLLSYLMVPFIWLWGSSNVTARLPILLASIAGAWALYRFMKENLGQRVGVLALLGVAIAPWHFMQSRWALEANLFPHMFILGFFFLSKGLQKSRYLYLSMVFFALCMYSYGVAFYMVPVFLMLSCILLLWRRRVQWKQVMLAAVVYFGLSWPIYGTMLINFVHWKTISLPFTTMSYFPNSGRSRDIVFFSDHPLQQFCTNAQVLWKQIFLQKPDLIWNALDDFGTLYLCSMPLVLAGAGVTVYRAVKGEQGQRIFCELLLIYWGSALLEGLCINNVNINRINVIFYCHIAFAAIAVCTVAGEWRRLGYGFAMVYALLWVLFLNQYFTDWAERMEDAFYADFLDAIEYAGEQEADYYYITPDSQLVGSWGVSQILTMYALQMDVEYFQGKTDVFRGAEIAYAERYHFSNAEGEQIRDDLSVVYVIRAERLDDYVPERFERRQFGKYYVIMPWKYAGQQPGTF